MAKLTAERLNLQTTNVVDAGIKDSYVFADDWDMPDGAKLSLWMLGFLY